MGKLVDFKMEEGGILAPEIARLLATLRTPILPEKEVKAGDTWQTEFDNPAVKGKKFTVKTTFVGTDKVEGMDVWKIQQSGEPATLSVPTKVVLTVNFLPFTAGLSNSVCQVSPAFTSFSGRIGVRSVASSRAISGARMPPSS